MVSEIAMTPFDLAEGQACTTSIRGLCHWDINFEEVLPRKIRDRRQIQVDWVLAHLYISNNYYARAGTLWRSG